MKRGVLLISSVVVVLILIFLIIVFAPILFGGSHEKINYPTGKDTYYVFGDGRFQIGRYNIRLALDDGKFNTVLISDVEKYTQVDDSVYFVGYFFGNTYTTDSINWTYESFDPSNGRELTFKTIEEVPRYTILDYRTGQIGLYKTLDEVPEEDKKIFEQGTNLWCLWIRTCYTK